ncbi:MAG: hypothetical protein ACI8ZM_002116 [Crocinitomix sp.]|jgi:hypothetical protein
MKLKLFTSALLLFILLSACGGDKNFEEKNIDGQFTIELPTYMVEIDLGIPQASVQYGNEMKEHYITVIKESAPELEAYGVVDVATYADVYVSGIEMSIESAVVNQIGDGIEEHNGMQTVTFEVNGVLPEENLEIYYYVKFYKSETTYYYVLDWTMANFKDDYLSDMKRITNSIKEL